MFGNASVIADLARFQIDGMEVAAQKSCDVDFVAFGIVSHPSRPSAGNDDAEVRGRSACRIVDNQVRTGEFPFRIIADMPVMIGVLSDWRGRHMGGGEQLSLRSETDRGMDFRMRVTEAVAFAVADDLFQIRDLPDCVRLRIIAHQTGE